MVVKMEGINGTFGSVDHLVATLPRSTHTSPSFFSDLPPKMSPKFPIPNLQSPRYFFTLLSILLYLTPIISSRTLPTIASFSHLSHDSSITYLWPLPSEFTSGNETLAVDPDLSLSVSGNGGNSVIITEAFERYRTIIFKHVGSSKFGGIRTLGYDISKLTIVVNSNDEELQLGVDESYTLLVAKNNGLSVIGEVTIEVSSHVRKHSLWCIAWIRGMITTGHSCATFSQLCGFDYGTKTVQIYKAPWFIRDKPRFVFRGLLLDEQSFPLEVPAYPKLWEGAYTKWERYSVEDAYEIVNFAKMRGINVMAEIDIPGHAESCIQKSSCFLCRGNGYPDLWPSDSCKEPLDVSKNFTFEVLSGILEDMRQIFPFELFHLGGDEVNTG
ncbi:Glycoside hydrolase, catalytic domain-containing protein [Cynara cardunculus var. scolymus]|uniref:beta-N-acetylhexosaminidase n=1 Tax=Cynara cardunculus var. scolymus TaxID=59895 RepID=A0A103YD67_CYNCS|nr:Glycoside hydrolase, catalytic domain-containing protein [Cynara cardunculus var. scolymus]